MTPEQLARDTIDANLEQAGWRVQSKNSIDFNAGAGIAVREYQTDAGPADYVLFRDLEFAPFDAQGGLGRMYQLFGDRMDRVINELNDALSA